jgi:hypothetical protein
MIFVLAITAFGAYATLGDGKANTKPAKKSLLTNKIATKPGSFTLRSGYNFRGKQVINTSENNNYINLNTVVNFHSGHTSYTVPLKKKVLLNNKIVFNPNSATRR